MEHRIKKKLPQAVWFLIVLFFFLLTVYPVIWMFCGSLKGPNEFYTNVWGLPSDPQWQNFADAWKNGAMGEKFCNSLIVTLGSLLLLIPINSCAAYAIGRLHFRGRRLIYGFLLMGIMIPSGVLGIPTFTVALRMGLNNTHLGLILIYVGQSIAMGVFIMRSFFISLPKELEEAAMIDGCTPFGSFLRVILPLASPGVMTQIIFNGLTIWNEYFMANIMLTKAEKLTLPLSIANFVGQHTTNYPVLFAALTIVTLPVVITYVLAQKGFIEGVSAGAVRG